MCVFVCACVCVLGLGGGGGDGGGGGVVYSNSPINQLLTPKTPPQIQRRELIPAGGEEELEIRACTVVAVERLREAIAAKFLGACVPVCVPVCLCVRGKEGEKEAAAAAWLGRGSRARVVSYWCGVCYCGCGRVARRWRRAAAWLCGLPWWGAHTGTYICTELMSSGTVSAEALGGGEARCAVAAPCARVP